SNGGQSAPDGRTVRARSRELAEALVGWRTVRTRGADSPRPFQRACRGSGGLADSPTQVGGRSATTSQICTREGVSLVGFKVERRTVHPWDTDGPPANLSFVPERLFLWFGLKSELRTVHPWGADGPQANSFLYQRACLSLVSQIS